MYPCTLRGFGSIKALPTIKALPFSLRAVASKISWYEPGTAGIEARMLPLCYAAPFNESSCNNVNQGSSQFPNYISFVKWYRTLSENYSKPFFVSVKWLEIITSVARLLFRSKIQKGVGDLHSSEVAFLPLTQWPRDWFSAFPKICFNVDEIYQLRCSWTEAWKCWSNPQK